MHLSAHSDIQAPADQIWLHAADMPAWVAFAQSQRMTVTPTGDMMWHVDYFLRRRLRHMTIERVVEGPGETAPLRFSWRSSLFHGQFSMNVVPLSRGTQEHNRVEAVLEVEPNNLGARFFLEAASLARGEMERGFSRKMFYVMENLKHRIFAASSSDPANKNGS